MIFIKPLSQENSKVNCDLLIRTVEEKKFYNASRLYQGTNHDTKFQICLQYFTLLIFLHVIGKTYVSLEEYSVFLSGSEQFSIWLIFSLTQQWPMNEIRTYGCSLTCTETCHLILGK